MGNQDYNILLKKLDQFIRRYYLTQMVKGGILTVAILLSSYLLIVILESVGHFESSVRTAIFYSEVVLIGVVCLWFVVRPLFGFLRIGKLISHREAAKILRNHFPEIKDKLENTLELAEMLNDEASSNLLIEAAINQKTLELKPIPFLTALPIKKSLRYAKYVVPPIAIIGLLLIVWPSSITEGTERIVKHKTDFIPPPPFVIELLNEGLDIRKGDDLELQVTTSGDVLPENMWLHFNGNRLLMQNPETNSYTYTLRSVNNSLTIHFESSDIKSTEYDINVLPAPSLLNFNVNIVPPSYTNEPTQKLSNQGNLTVLAGSDISWIFNTRSTDAFTLLFQDSTTIMADASDKTFTAQKKAYQSTAYTLSLSNAHFTDDQQIQYSINVIPDLYPQITVDEMKDSIDLNITYFNGIINDDYGFSELRFYYSYVINGKDSLMYVDIPYSAHQVPQEFYFAFDFSMMKDNDISSMKYYIQVADNDEINGYKTSRSQIKEINIPNKDEINELNDKANENINDKIKKAQDLSKKLENDIEDLQKKMIEKNMSKWEREESVKNIMQEQQKLENLTKEISKMHKEKNQLMDSYTERSEEIVEKQKQIEDLLEDLMDDELREMMEELQELMKKNKTDDMQELMRDMQMSMEDLNEQLDNNLDMLKQMEVEERLQNNIDQLDELAKKQEELSKKSKDKDSSLDKIKEEQEQLKKDMENLQEDYKKTLEKNENLEKPMQLPSFEEDFQKIEELMEESQEQLDKGKEKKASQSQQKSSEQMQQLSEKMKSAQQQSMMQGAQENMEDIKQLLENLVQFSFDQEDLMGGFNNISSRDPRYKDVYGKQIRLDEHFAMIDDSLTALGSRVPQIGSMIRKEQKSIKSLISTIGEDLDNNRLYKVSPNQQRVMTHANNLALLLSEVLDQMQQQMNNSKANSSCEGNCQKPGQGKPKMGEMRQRQQSLKNQMQQMLDMMKDGKKQGGKQGKAQQSKELAKMLAEQEIMQQMLNDMMSDQNISPEAAQMLKEINRMMEDNKNDLINKNITPTLLKRQEQILTRMLEAEQSEFEREIDKKRKSEEARDHKISNPEKAFQQSQEKQKFNELLEFNSIRLNKFYKEKYKEYLLKSNE